jgi:hypothetical protein
MLQAIVCCNLAQDWGPSFSDHKVHYTRPREPAAAQAQPGIERQPIRPLSPTNLQRARWNLDFSRWLDGQLTRFHELSGQEPDCTACCQMLHILGRVTHAWQDFFGHVMFYNRDNDSVTFDVWTRNPPLNPTPDDAMAIPQYVVPPQYPHDGEHPAISEPIHDPSLEFDRRKEAATKFTTERLSRLLDRWEGACRGLCDCLDCRCSLADLRRRSVPLRLFARLPTYCLWGSPKLTHLCSDKRTLSLTACRVAAVMVADAAVPRC